MCIHFENYLQLIWSKKQLTNIPRYALHGDFYDDNGNFYSDICYKWKN